MSHEDDRLRYAMMTLRTGKTATREEPMVTDFPKPPAFTPEQREALLKGEAVGVNGVMFSLANYLKPKGKLYGPPASIGSNSFAAYAADPAAWKATAAAVAIKMGKKPGELEQELGYDLLDEVISLLKDAHQPTTGESQ